MVLQFLLASSFFFCGIQSHQGDDMDDVDFELYLESHERIYNTYGETAAKGCLTGGIGGSAGGFTGLCIGCVLGAAGNVAQDMVFNSEASQKADEALRRRE